MPTVTPFPDTCESQPELLAHHYTEAGLPQHSVVYWRQAAQQALNSLAFLDANTHAQKGLAVLSKMPVSAERFQHELSFQTLLIKVSLTAGGNAIYEGQALFQRAYDLVEQVGNLTQHFDIVSSHSYAQLFRVELVSAHQLGIKSLELAQRAHDPILLRKAHRDVATALFFLGRQTETMQHLKQALPEKWTPRPFSQTIQHNQTAEAAVLRYQAWTEWLLGYPDQACRTIERASQLSQDNILSLGVDLFFSLTLRQWRRETDVMGPQLKSLFDLVEDRVLFPSSHLKARGSILHGWWLAQRGQLVTGMELIQRSITKYRGFGTDLFLPYFLGLLAELQGQGGDIETGLDTISEALTFVETNNERCWEAELYRLRAELLLRRPNPNVDTAEVSFHQALAVARQQRAKSLELRATTSLTRLWLQQGKHDQARRQLTSLYNGFTEGHSSADLTDARAVLDELAYL